MKNIILIISGLCIIITIAFASDPNYVQPNVPIGGIPPTNQEFAHKIDSNTVRITTSRDVSRSSLLKTRTALIKQKRKIEIEIAIINRRLAVLGE